MKELERFPTDTHYVVERSEATMTQTVTAYSPLGVVLGRFTVTDEQLVRYERRNDVRDSGPGNNGPRPDGLPNPGSGNSSPRRELGRG